MTITGTSKASAADGNGVDKAEKPSERTSRA